VLDTNGTFSEADAVDLDQIKASDRLRQNLAGGEMDPETSSG
jgi:hypothetical protein